MNIAIIGAGSIGARHITNTLDLGHEVVVIDNDQEALDQVLRKHGVVPGGSVCVTTILGFNTLYSMPSIYKSLDAVVIATPAGAHLEALHWAFSRKLPVYCEKPLALTSQVSEATALASLFNKDKIPNRIGYNRRFHPSVTGLHSRVAGRPLVWTRFHLYCNMAEWPGSAGQGEMVPECSHELDLLWMFNTSPFYSTHHWHGSNKVHLFGGSEGGSWEVVIANVANPELTARGYELLTKDGMTYTGAWGVHASMNQLSERSSLASFFEQVYHTRLVPAFDLVHGARVLHMAHESRRSA